MFVCKRWNVMINRVYSISSRLSKNFPKISNIGKEGTWWLMGSCTLEGRASVCNVRRRFPVDGSKVSHKHQIWGPRTWWVVMGDWIDLHYLREWRRSCTNVELSCTNDFLNSGEFSTNTEYGDRGHDEGLWVGELIHAGAGGVCAETCANDFRSIP